MSEPLGRLFGHCQVFVGGGDSMEGSLSHVDKNVPSTA